MPKSTHDAAQPLIAGRRSLAGGPPSRALLPPGLASTSPQRPARHEHASAGLRCHGPPNPKRCGGGRPAQPAMGGPPVRQRDPSPVWCGTTAQPAPKATATSGHTDAPVTWQQPRHGEHRHDQHGHDPEVVHPSQAEPVMPFTFPAHGAPATPAVITTPTKRAPLPLSASAAVRTRRPRPGSFRARSYTAQPPTPGH